MHAIAVEAHVEDEAQLRAAAANVNRARTLEDLSMPPEIRILRSILETLERIEASLAVNAPDVGGQ
jgi:hypothetical protein